MIKIDTECDKTSASDTIKNDIKNNAPLGFGVRYYINTDIQPIINTCYIAKISTNTIHMWRITSKGSSANIYVHICSGGNWCDYEITLTK